MSLMAKICLDFTIKGITMTIEIKQLHKSVEYVLDSFFFFLPILLKTLYIL